ncbi:MAG: hypothetical protein J6N95_05645 [Bacilli bacterium]|nr:hypothetical protein [Bacilli bacterium]
MMENLTLGGINTEILFIVTFCGGVFAIYKAVKSAIDKGLKPIYDKINVVDMNATKNFLVPKIAELKAGNKLDEVTRKQVIDQYEHYISIGGNSFIKLEYDKLVKEGKI